MQGLGVVSIKNKIEVYLSAAHVCFKGKGSNILTHSGYFYYIDGYKK